MTDPAGVRTGLGVSFGTFGELLQGALEPDLDFLVTLPIARWSTARVTLTPGTPELTVEPGEKLKALRVAMAVLARHGVTDGGTLSLHSELPEGKGMSSSSADLVATVRAVGDAVGVRFTPAQTESYLREVEPTDGLMYRDVVAFHHRQVRLHRVLGPVPPLTIVGVDEGGQVDTVDFNASRPVIAAAHRREYRELLDVLATALEAGDVATVGRVATRSAELNQERCHKRHLDRVREICREVGGLGIVVAHSGTMVGITFSGTDARLCDQVQAAVSACAELGPVSVDRTLDTVTVPALTRTAGTEGDSYVD